MKHIHFVGIAGSGMNPLARFLASKRQYRISGSDRVFDSGNGPQLRSLLEKSGIAIVPQDGSSLTGETEKIVISGAIEDTVPEIQIGKKYSIPIITRAELLAFIINSSSGIAVSGTSGKTTVTGMSGTLFNHAGLKPNIICGGLLKEFIQGAVNDNVIIDESDLIIFEADESDGSIVQYNPEAGVLLNITKDHKPVKDLLGFFNTFVQNCTSKFVYNNDDELVKECLKDHEDSLDTVSFGWNSDADVYPINIKLHPWGSSFTVNNEIFELHVPGKHNISNALASIALGSLYGVPMDSMKHALGKFKGMQRRLDLIGTHSGITVIDDFAHNPDKIEASVSTLQPESDRLIIMFQPHGFGPTKFLKNELIDVFSDLLRKEDVLLIPEIYYAGGTVTRDISSKDLINPIAASGKNAFYFETREDIFLWILNKAQSGDTICIMGARDDTLTAFAKNIFEALKQRS